MTEKCNVGTHRGSNILGIGVSTPCGKKCLKGKPYCSYHSPQSVERRNRDNEDKRGVTRRNKELKRRRY